MLRLLFIVPVILATVLATTAIGATEFSVRTWQSEDGLPGNVVRSIAQGPDGFLWVATAEGITRFDGLRFDTVRAANPYRNRRAGYYRIFALSDGSVWVSTFQKGLLRVEDLDLRVVQPDLETPTDSLITQLVEVDGAHWARVGTETHRVSPEGLISVASPPEAVHNALLADHFRHRRDRIIEGPGPATRTPLWFLDAGRQLHHAADHGEASLFHHPDLPGPVIANEIFSDREENIWLATPIHGLVRLRENRVRQFQTDAGTLGSGILAALQDRQGAWWMSKRSGGIQRVLDGEVTELEMVPGGYPRPITCIFEDSKGRLWFAGRDGSVFERVGDDFVRRFTGTQTPSKVKAMTEDPSGQIWFGGSQGLACWDGETVRTHTEAEGVPELDISSLATLPNGSILAGTIQGQLVVGGSAGFRSLDTPAPLQGRWITSILPVDSEEIWVTSLGAGLFLYREGRWTRFGRLDGMPDERLTGITRHGEDQLWLGSLGGILRVARSELLRRITNRSILPSWLALDRSDGMLTRECVGGSQPALWHDDAGTIWFPTSRGLAGVRPERIQSRLPPPPVHIRPVSIDGSPHPVTEAPIVTGPGRVRLEFSYGGISLGAPEAVTYRIRLIGLDDEFRFVGNRREVGYEAVPPGNYRFEVNAINGDGVSAIRPAMVDLVIRPHLWERPWFLITCSLVVVLFTLGIGWSFARVGFLRRLHALKMRSALEDERARIASDLHDDLGASLTELSILSALAAEEPGEDGLRQSLDQLSLKSKRVVTALDEIVWAANPTEDSLRSLIDYLAAFAREFLDSVQIPLRTDVVREIPDLMIGPRRRHSVFLATREAINNAVKHADASSIHLRIAIEDGQLVIQVRDDGKGFAVEYAESGNGLSNLRQRMLKVGGTCTIESHRREGTVVTLTLPLPAA